MVEIGDIYTVKIQYRDNQSRFKVRPVFIFNVDIKNDIYTIAEITTQKPSEKYYCQFKELIIKWEDCGLYKKSYVKCKNIHNFKRSELIKFIGYVEYDLVNILTKIIEYNK